MSKPKTSGRILLISIILLGILATGIAVWLEANRMGLERQANALQSGTAFSKPLTLQPFKLINTNNQQLTNKALKGHWSLLFFGFTHCPMICPTTLTKLNETYKILEEIDAKQLPQVVFISIDPERDSPTQIKKYLKHFNSNFIGATGTPTNIKQLTQNLGIVYAKAKKSNEKNYQINHSSIILIINPKGQWAGILAPPFEPAIMAQDFIKIQRMPG